MPTRLRRSTDPLEKFAALNALHERNESPVFRAPCDNIDAAHTLAQLVTESDLTQGSLYPALPRIREVSAQIAAAVAGTVYRNELAGKPGPADMPPDVRAHMFDPRY